VFNDLFERTFSDLQCSERGFQILARVSLKKFASLVSQPFDDLVPLFYLLMSFRTRFVLYLSAQPRMLERFFHRVFNDLKREHAVRQVLVTGAFIAFSSFCRADT
jgi:hypothetical protein